jgi:hypothetical protein
MERKNQKRDAVFDTVMAFRRQFILGPEYSEINPGWKRHLLNSCLCLSVHPDLPCIRVEEGCRSLTLLGYILDPEHPESDDKTILKKLLRESVTVEDIFSAFDTLMGRWAVIYITGGRVVVFHDPTGMRQIYYARDDSGRLWLGSRPCLLTHATGHAPDLNTRQQLLSDGAFSPHVDHFWPGESSAFLGIQRLLPNHCIDATSGQVSRFWPRLPIPKISEEEGVIQCTAKLTGAISAAARRFPLAFAITAGLDSRLLLAASRDVSEKMSFYTVKRPGMYAISPDIYIPKKMMGDLGFHRHVIFAQPISGGPVSEALNRAFYPIHQSVLHEVAALIEKPPRTDGAWVTVNGNVCEIARCFYRRVEVTPENLASSAGMGNSQFAAVQFRAWYENAKPAIESAGINPWDLFYWEQKMGGWFGTIRSQFDLAEEVFTPYNSRSLLVTMLGVDESLRSEPHYPFFKKMISSLWPTLLEYPINPNDYVRLIRNRYLSMVNGAMGMAKAGAQLTGIYPLYAAFKKKKS